MFTAYHHSEQPLLKPISPITLETASIGLTQAQYTTQSNASQLQREIRATIANSLLRMVDTPPLPGVPSGTGRDNCPESRFRKQPVVRLRAFPETDSTITATVKGSFTS